MKRLQSQLCLIFLLLSGLSLQALADDAKKQLISAWQNKQAMPVLSSSYPDLRPYPLQSEFVRSLLQDEQPAGFKAGLTTTAAQQKFAVIEPVAGVLLPGAALISGAKVRLQDSLRPMLELELAFYVGRAITQPVADVAELKTYLTKVAPALELPDLAFTDLSKLTGADIIASNVAARKYVLGASKSLQGFDVNAVKASLTLNDEIVQSAVADAVMGDQWQALLWLVNRTIANGWAIEPGQVLLTGAMGKMLPLKAGQYIADYGSLGKVRLTVIQ